MDSKILRINMSELKINEEEVSKDYLLLNGRELTTKIMSDEIPENCNPLKEKTKL